jgi:hypothetical protein
METEMLNRYYERIRTDNLETIKTYCPTLLH